MASHQHCYGDKSERLETYFAAEGSLHRVLPQKYSERARPVEDVELGSSLKQTSDVITAVPTGSSAPSTLRDMRNCDNDSSEDSVPSASPNDEVLDKTVRESQPPFQGARVRRDALQGEFSVHAGKEQGKGSTTLLIATMELVNFTFGVITMMSVPSLFKGTDAIAVFGFFLLAVCVVIATGWLLGIVLEQASTLQASPDYPSIALLVFGKLGGSFITVLSLLDCVLYIVALFIMMEISVPLFLPVPAQDAFAFCAVVAAMVQVLPQRAFSAVATLSSLTTVIACSMVVMTGFFLSDVQFEAPRYDLSRLSSAFGVPFYGCAFHVYFPAIYNRVASRRVYNEALVLSNLAFLVAGCCFGFVVYMQFGSALQHQAAFNIGRDVHLKSIPALWWTGPVVGLMIFLKNLFVLKPAAQPVLDIIMNMASRVAKLSGSPRKLLSWTVALVLYFILSAISAWLADDVILFESAVGMSLYAVLGIICPLIWFLRLVSTCRALHYLCLFGVLFGWVLVVFSLVVCLHIL